MDKNAVKSRKERRKEVRSAKQQQRLQSWVQHQASKKRKKYDSMLFHSNKMASDDKNSTVQKKLQKSQNNVKPNNMPSKSSRMKALAAKQSNINFKEDLEMQKNEPNNMPSKSSRMEALAAKQSNINFKEDLEMQKNEPFFPVKKDLASEMHPAKKLKVKKEGIPGHDDGMHGMVHEISVDKEYLEVATNGKELKLSHDQEAKDGAVVSILDKQSKYETKRKSKLKNKKPKTNFEQYLEMEGHKTFSADKDLAMEQHLAKRLKVKHGKLGGYDDGLNDLIGEICSYNDFEETEHDMETEKKIKKTKKLGMSSDKKSKSSKPSEVSTSHVKNEVRVVLGCIKKSEMSVEDNTVFHDAEEDHMKLEESEACVEKVHRNESESFKGNSMGTDKSESREGSARLKADRQHSAANSLVKYVAPHLRSNSGTVDDESVQIRRHIRGLLNRLSESNVESVAAEVSSVFQAYGRRLAAQIVGDEVLASCSKGPRGNEQYAAVFASFVSGIAASVGMDFGAKLLASLAISFEEYYREEDSLALRNLTLFLANLYTFGLCSSDLIYDLLDLLSKRLEEVDVSTILTLLQCCGMNLRSDDPTAMKDFIVGIQQRVHELKAVPPTAQDGKPKVNGKRMEFMLETICEIKNNKKRSKAESPPHTRLKKWLQKLRVDDVQLRGIKWNKLLDPNKKGQWWLSGDIETSGKDPTAEIADAIDAEVAEAQKILHLASAQRMNTEARRAIFCIIMSGEDYLDAFEKILRLNLSGKQDREILRVLVECCLQEKAYNKYYSLLAAKLCHHDKNHKFSLQYCLWDHFKQLDSMELRRLANLARFLADLIGSVSLSLSVLKAVDLTDGAVLTSKVVMHFRILFETLFTHYPDDVIWNIFTRIASPPELENLRIGLELFIHQHVNKNALTGEQLGSPESASLIISKFKVAKKALANVAGVLL